MLDMQSYLHFNKITMVFPGVKALSDVSFSAKEGSIHALMGENGAGKSTLLKILSGVYQATIGSLIINGQEHKFQSAAQALEQGVAIIYQELNLVPELTVAENIYLGQMPTKNGMVDKQRLLTDAMVQLKRLGENIHPSTPLKHLSIGQWQMVEIAKALSRNAKIIAFDEPTSSLSSREIDNLFKVIRELRDEGKVIIYVSHRMEEIFRLCDSLTVFKDGTHVQTFYDMTELTQDRLVKLMVGREINDVYRYRPREYGTVGLQLTNLIGPGLKKPVSLTIQKGEVLGLFGLIGAGRTELTRLIFGAERATSGTIQVDGQLVTIKSPQDAIRKGITYCPEDRKMSGIIPIATVQENTNISARPWHLRLKMMINPEWEHENATKQIADLRVKTPSAQQIILNLSGGNQQKVILGRWLSTEMKVILLDEPTRGIDVGSKAEIYDLIFKLAEEGVTVLVISSDLPEILGISDRLLIMKEGGITGELNRDQFNEEKALRLAMLDEIDLAQHIA